MSATPSSTHNIPVLISQYVAAVGTNNDDVLQNYVSEIVDLFTTTQLTLLQFIQQLGPTLTSDNEVMRSRGMQFLSSVLSQLPPGHLSRQDVGVMIDFLMNKFDDKLSLIHALSGINTLIGCKLYTNSLNSEKILAKLSNGYDPRKNLAKVRHEAFQILSSLLDNNKVFITTSVADLYVKTFIHIASGEKDPRNLLQSFKLNRRINKEFGFGDSELHKEFITDLFDVCFCYFPISFTPPANDPYKITPEELKLQLRQVIASQSRFATESIPSLVEKLASTNPVIRNDTLKTIALCVENYTADTVNSHWLSLWNALKFELLHNECAPFKPTMESIVPEDYTSIDDNDEVKVLFLTLVILETMVNKLPQSREMLQTVVDELGPNLQKDKSKPSVVILASLASTSLENYNFIIDYLFSFGVWGKYFNVGNNDNHPEDSDTDMDKNEDFTLNISKQRDLVDNLGFILIAYPSPGPTNLIKYKDHLLIFLCQILSNSSNLEKTLRCKVVQQLSKLMTIPQFLTTTNTQLILQIFKTQIEENLALAKKDLVVDEIVGNLSSIMANDPSFTSIIIDQIVNPVLNGEAIAHDANFKYVLDIIQNLTINHQVLEIVSIRLMNKTELTVDSLQVVIEFFISLLNKVELVQPFLTNSWYKKFIPNLMNKLVQLVPGNYGMNDGELDNGVLGLLEVSGDLIRIIIRFIDVGKHQSILNEMYDIFCTDGDSESKLLFVYQGNLSHRPDAYITIYNKVISAIDKSCQLAQVQDAVSSVTTILSHLQDKYLRVQYLQHLCLLVNKFGSQLTTQFTPELSFTNLNQFEIYIWTLKANLLKIDAKGISSLVDLLDIYQSSTTSVHHKLMIIRALPLLVIDLKVFVNMPPALSKKIVSKVNNLNVKLLYKQQVFETVLPYLLNEGVGDAQGDDRGDGDSDVDVSRLNIEALSLILPHIPHKILVPHLPAFLPFITTALGAGHTAKSATRLMIYKSGLKIMEIILEENATIIESKVSTIVPRLAQLAAGTNDGGVVVAVDDGQVKKQALANLILVFTKFDHDVIEPFKKPVLKQLELCLDDKRRSVRKLAIDLRQILYEMR
ncbi:hypothetical protein CANMA_003105 [Candida margitis]|uniref:uncharacterized protein n=1 Tax=Candida margitis TaxID=1775924 RepID=UPI002225F914|nr:uncharacterized protein CANMA_003105 [Candida margitis]KAI5967285.1 hypothetical protein CANMA_003105 [Candida margitis]